MEERRGNNGSNTAGYIIHVNLLFLLLDIMLIAYKSRFAGE